MKTFFLSFLLLMVGVWGWGQCPTGDITLTTQGQVDSFAINYPGCTTILGSVNIDDGTSTNSIQNLDGLAQITTIKGDLEFFWCDLLSDIGGLNSVDSIGGKFRIVGCDVLTSISGMNSLKTIGGDLYFNINNGLENLDGLESLNAIGGWLRLSDNDALENINALSSLTSVGGKLEIGYNDALENIDGLNALTFVQESITIEQNDKLLDINGFNGLSNLNLNLFIISSNDSLTNIDGFSALNSIGGTFSIYNNPSLKNCLGFNSLDSVGEDFVIRSNKNLLSLQGFESLTYVGNDLIIDANDKLVNLNGLQSITTIGKNIQIVYNRGLTSLDYFPAVTSVEGNLEISYDTLLSNINGLSNIISVSGDLDIISIYGLTNLQGLDALQSVGGSIVISYCKGLTNLLGLESISSIGGLSIWYNDLLPNLYNIPSVSTIQGGLSIFSNSILTNLSGLENITSIEGDVEIRENTSLTSLFGINSIIYFGGDVKINDNHSLTNLNGFPPVSSIGGNLIISRNESLTSLNNLEAITTVAGNLWVKENDILTTLEGLGSIFFVGGSLSITSNKKLISLAGLESLISMTGNITILYNDELSDCSLLAVCNGLINNPSTVVVGSNTVGCNSEAEVQQSCSYLSNSTGSVYFDINCNGLFDEFDVISPHAILKKVGSNIPIATTNSDGEYKATFYQSTTNDYTVTPPLGYSPQPVSYTIVTSSISQQFPNRDFRLCPDSLFHNLKTTLTPVNVPRPGFTNQYQVCVQNLGTQPENATLTLDFSIGEGAQYITIVDAAGGTIQNNIITWNISDLQLFDSECFSVTIQLATNTPLGIYLQPTANVSITPAQTETILSDNLVALNDQVVGSYDPNDKTVDMPNIVYDPTSGVTRLQYKIRFQNTGTFPATFIEVLDTLESKLDIRTIEMVASSHDYTLSFPSPNVLKWRFDDINLPDSTSNEPESHGFIVFNISTITPINLGEMVQNRAGIYFDFNEPVITNYATTSFTVGTHDPFGLGSLPLSIAPNPTQDNVTLRYSLLESADSELLITNAQGVVVQSQSLGKQGVGDYALPVDLVGLPAGLYLVTVRTGGLVGVGKVVRM